METKTLKPKKRYFLYKEINPNWHYFLNIYFILTMILLVIGILFVLSNLEGIKTISEIFHQLVDYYKNNSIEINNSLNDISW